MYAQCHVPSYMYVHVYRAHMFSEDAVHACLPLHSCHVHGVAGSPTLDVHKLGRFPNAQSPNSKLTMNFAEKTGKIRKNQIIQKHPLFKNIIWKGLRPVSTRELPGGHIMWIQVIVDWNCSMTLYMYITLYSDTVDLFLL